MVSYEATGLFIETGVPIWRLTQSANVLPEPFYGIREYGYTPTATAKEFAQLITNGIVGFSAGLVAQVQITANLMVHFVMTLDSAPAYDGYSKP